MSVQFEVLHITPSEVHRLKGVQVVESRYWIANARCVESAAVAAVAHAENNLGDGDYCVNDSAGRAFAIIHVRDGAAEVKTVTNATAAGDQLDSLKSRCPACERRFILVPCVNCGTVQCSSCCLSRKCCPPIRTPQEE